MRTSGLTRIAVVVVSSALATCGVAACGSSSSSSTGNPSTSAGATQAADSSGVATATNELAPVLKYPNSIGVSTPLKRSPSGKTVDYIECGVSECKIIGDYLQKGAQALGIRVNLVPAGNTAESTAQAFVQAVQNKPNGVVSSGVSKALYAKQLAQLKQLGIPVVSMGTADLPGTGDGLAQVLLGRDSYVSGGKYAADWAIADSKGKANVLLVTAPVFDFNKPLADSFQATMKRNCPGCTVHVMGVSPNDIGKGVPSQIVSYLQQNPNTDYVITSFGSLMIGVPQAVQAAGIQGKVSLFTVAPTTADFENTRAGIEKGNLASSKQYLGWMTADQIARAMTGQAPTKIVNDGKLPWWHIFNKSDEKWDIKTAPDWPYFNGFQDQFTKLWGMHG